MLLAGTILFMVGLITLFLGIGMIIDSRYNNAKFLSLMKNLKTTNPDWTLAMNIYNNKCNALSLYGALSIVYGLTVAAISVYLMYSGQYNINNNVIIGISVVGVILLVLSLTLKKIRSPDYVIESK